MVLAFVGRTSVNTAPMQQVNYAAQSTFREA